MFLFTWMTSDTHVRKTEKAQRGHQAGSIQFSSVREAHTDPTANSVIVGAARDSGSDIHSGIVE